MTSDSPNIIENRTLAEIAVGDSASLSKTLTEENIELFAMASGDVDPAQLDPAYATGETFHRVIAHGMLGAGLLSAVIGTRLPGPGTVYLGQDLTFLLPVSVGDTVTATVMVTQKDKATGTLVLDCLCVNQEGKAVISGTARVRAPVEKVRMTRAELPDVQLARHQRFNAFISRAAGGTAVTLAVAHPCDAVAVEAAVEAAEAGLVRPILVGPQAKIERAAEAAGVDISGFERVDTPHSDAAAAAAVELVRCGKADLLMKGSLHTDELLRAVLDDRLGLKTKRRLSHVYLMDVPRHPKPLLITDAAVNIAPGLSEKRDIVQNAVDLAHVMGTALPKVAVLSAVETVNPAMPSTLEAAALCKMAQRGQITGALVDGPLAFDNAVSLQAAKDKGIVSEVAGDADILVVPDLEAGNMLAKQLTFLAGADAAGVVLGARVPIVLTSRADSARTRLASCAVAVLVVRARQAAPAVSA